MNFERVFFIGKIQNAVIWSKSDNNSFEVRWFENGIEFGIVLKRSEIIRPFFFSSLIKKFYTIGLFFAIFFFAMIVDAVIKKKQDLEMRYHECILDRDDKIFELFGKTYCENRASYWNVIFFLNY